MDDAERLCDRVETPPSARVPVLANHITVNTIVEDAPAVVAAILEVMRSEKRSPVPKPEPPLTLKKRLGYIARLHLRSWTHGDVPGSGLRVLVTSLAIAIFLGPIFYGSVWWNGFLIAPFVLLVAFPMFLGSLLVIGLLTQIHHFFFFGSWFLLVGSALRWWSKEHGSRWLDYAFDLAVFTMMSGCGADEKDPEKQREQHVLGYYGMNYLLRRRHHISYILDVLPYVFWNKEWKLELAPTPLDVLEYRYPREFHRWKAQSLHL